jgi:hypothetical protein
MTRSKQWNSVFVSFAMLACSCAPTWGFRETAFEPELEHYAISYADPSARTVVRPGWLADNFRRNQQGNLVANTSGPFAILYNLDTDNDGTVDRSTVRPLYDLRLVHREDGTVLWMRTMPLDIQHADRSLANLARNYVEAVAGTTYVSVNFSSPMGTARTHATRIVSEMPTTLDGREAFDVTFDVIDLDQREVTPDAVANRVRIILARPDPSYRFMATTRVSYPVVVVIGVASNPNDFDRHVSDYDDLLSRFTWQAEREPPPPPRRTAQSSRR